MKNCKNPATPELSTISPFILSVIEHYFFRIKSGLIKGEKFLGLIGRL